MANSEDRVKDMEIKIAEIQRQVSALESEMGKKLDENAIKVLVEDRIGRADILTKAEVQGIIEERINKDDILTKAEIRSYIMDTLTDKGYITDTEVHILVKRLHITQLRWVIGIVMTGGTMTLALIRLFLM